MSGASDIDVAIIGAGAAGIGAGLRLKAAGLSFRIFEARDRAGGRAFTQRHAGYPLDLGCGWLHSADRNPWCGVLADAGFAVDKTVAPWRKRALSRKFSQADQTAFLDASERFYERLEAAAAQADQPAARILEPGSRWNGLLDAVSTYVNGVELDHVSVQDFHNYDDSGVNWRVPEGYGAGIAAQAAHLPVTYGCAVTTLDHRGTHLRLTTTKGVVAAAAAIVTLPTPLIAREALRFDPPLPEKREAAAVLPLGLANKVTVAVADADDLPLEAHMFGATDTVATPSYHLRPFGRPLIEGYFGGRLAQELEQAGSAAFFDFVHTQLVDLFGTAMGPRLTPLAASAWRTDPFASGSYSYALPGHAAARARLAEPVDGRIFFAGEACSKHDFSTAHGAYLTGVAAAKAVLSAQKAQV